MAERQFGPYRLVRQIAVGGMAEIHLAKTKGIAGFEKYVALKMIHPNFAEDEQFIQMLVDEAKIAVQLNHGNIAQTFDLGRVGDQFYITMEYVDGADLYKILRRGSEIDFEMPLDVCAFVAKEIASALDHAHRKRDHNGKTLGIVHRDVSPQNVLISFSGEVKLVDFGIAKATMKARQTAVGVIKGKYYYMSPEQAWGDQIDYRSDIFSAGIVLYEMMTGQMLYLEEDLHKLLDMVRKADIAPPSTLRKGIPPQLEKIVMHALDKDRRNRYQSASDFASDLERFLHTYSPVFTASKVSTVIKQVIGAPTEVPAEDYEVEVRDGPMSTHTLSTDDLILDKEELHDENSVIFRVDDLKPKHDAAKKPVPAGPRVTRQAEIKDAAPPKPAAIPSVPRKAPTPAAGQQRAPTAKPRDKNESTRQVEPAPLPPDYPGEDSGLLSFKTPPPLAAPAWSKRHDSESTEPGDVGDLENIGESTMITGAPKGFGGFMMDNASEDGVDATVVSSGPPSAEQHDTAEEALDDDEDAPTLGGGANDEDGPTIQRDYSKPKDNRQPKVAAKRGPPPAALAANIQAPAVSALHKPRASRKTPAGGVPAVQPNVLQAIVNQQGGAPMPTPPRQNPQMPTQALQPPMQQQMPPPQQPQMQQPMPPQAYNGYAADASGLPMTPPQGVPVAQQQYGQQQPYGYPQYPPQQPYQQPSYPGQAYQQPVSPGALYQLQPYGAPPPKPMSLTGQLRLFEADELPAHYNVSSGGRWIKLAIAGILAISVAAGVTFFIIKSTRDSAPTVGRVNIDSVPPGAEVVFDGTRLAGATPMTVDSVPVGTRHEIKVELPRHKPYVETVDIPKTGGEVPVKAMMVPITGKLRVITTPDGAEIWIDGKLRGRAPTTIADIDMGSAKLLELRLKDYKPYQQSLQWPANGEINIDAKLQK
ncbi:MAG TPA: protein kinase [Kofleriaceae bacterium]|nr:protein kinase [Kofleriaceae bacterium]